VVAEEADRGKVLEVVRNESGNVALGVDLPIIAAVSGLLVGDVNPLEIEGVAGFASHDVRGHGAGAGGVVELHMQFLSMLLIGRTAVRSGEGASFCSLRSISFDGHFATAQQGRGPLWVKSGGPSIARADSAVR